ncbi:MAG: Translation initiation factor IF-2 [Parcubacteria group bacterium GW2011_GWA2_42_35]|nr:MAG: Translation initiation factor IF-2 [Parcubacteria group bacterium GW2011_GWC2_42_13]KKS57037.1 MAG: Translation initiation factor IF-2 [Parcubacteria group bacterium GW2011_GWA2_42_35]
MPKTNPQPNNSNLIPRPPIVVVMGHIDHGKTKLLDCVRKTKVAEGEAGGITQHIGAYEVEIKNKKITFIDTPGHEAFSKIRSRGARAADIAVLVVAADEGVKPQTVEAIKTIEQAQIPFLVAINKIDKPEANPEKIKKELSENNVFVEKWGGQVPAVNISAKTGEGVEELLETILLMAEMEELKADPNLPASGVIIESHLDPQRGNVATLLILNGFLKQGMFVAAGQAAAPVKIFEDFLGKKIETAGFSSPIRITGFDELPEVGVVFQSFLSKKEALQYAETKKTPSPSLNFGETKKETESQTTQAILPIVVKADTAGSLEAVCEQIKKLEIPEVLLNILRRGVGNINEDDVKLASASEKNPVIVGFNVGYESKTAELAEKFGVLLKIFKIIYDINDWLKEEIVKRKPVVEKEVELGKVKILKIFRVEKDREIIGGKVSSGKIIKGKEAKILRRGADIGRVKILNLERGRIKTEQAEAGDEFGALVESKTSLSPGDELEVFEKQSL